MEIVEKITKRLMLLLNRARNRSSEDWATIVLEPENQESEAPLL